jgi:hypothetical protein
VDVTERALVRFETLVNVHVVGVVALVVEDLLAVVAFEELVVSFGVDPYGTGQNHEITMFSRHADPEAETNVYFQLSRMSVLSQKKRYDFRHDHCISLPARTLDL